MVNIIERMDNLVMDNLLTIHWQRRAAKLREAGLDCLAENYHFHGVNLFPDLSYPIHKDPKYRNADGNESIEFPDPSLIEPSHMADSLLDLHFGFDGDTVINRHDFLQCIELGWLIARYAHYYGKSITSRFIKLSHKAYVLSDKADLLGRSGGNYTAVEMETLKALHLKAKDLHAKTWPRRQPTDAPPPYEAPSTSFHVSLHRALNHMPPYPAYLWIWPDLSQGTYKSTAYLDADGSDDPSIAFMTPSDMKASLKEMKDELDLNRPINYQDSQKWIALGRSISKHARHYGRTITGEFVRRSEDACKRPMTGVKVEERELMVAFCLKAMEYEMRWHQEESSEDFSDRTYAHLPWAQARRKRTDPPGYEDEAPPPYTS